MIVVNVTTMHYVPSCVKAAIIPYMTPPAATPIDPHQDQGPHYFRLHLPLRTRPEDGGGTISLRQCPACRSLLPDTSSDVEAHEEWHRAESGS